MAEALYRKYRPQVFEDVVGQDRIERTIKNAIDQDKVSHAYLFCGPRGTGKTTTARLLAKALLCKQGPTSEPDGSCEDCLMIANSEHPDVYELDAASRTGVENVREEIIGRVQFAPTRGRYKVYIIDEVHMLSTAAFNALLKTLEEPPGHVVFILCTTDPQKVPETIHSRCQRFDFRRISPEAIVLRLGAICVSEEVEFEGEALDLIAYRADGGMRNALTSLEQVIAYGDGKVTLADTERLLGSIDVSDMAEIVQAIGRRDAAACFVWTAHYVETGADLAQFTHDLTEHIRNMYVLSLAGTDTALEVSETTRRELVSELELFGPDRLARLLCVLGDLSAELKTSTNQQLSFEIALTRMIRPESDLTLESLAERIEALETLEALEARPAAAALGTGAVGSATTGAGAVGSAASGDGAVGSAASGAAVSSAATAPVSSRSQVSLDNPATLQRIWQSVLTSVKKTKAAYGVLFLGTRTIYDAASDTVIVQFPAENSFAFSAVQKPDVTSVVEDALAKAVGREVAFRFEQLPSGNVSGNASDQSAAPVAVSASVATATASAPAIRPVSPSLASPAVSAPEATTASPLMGCSSRPVAEMPRDSASAAPEAVTRASQISPSDAAARQSTPDISSEPSTAKPELPPDTTGSAMPANLSVTPDDIADMDSILAAGFGDGISFEEVDEPLD